MKKQNYISPETTWILLQIEAPLCQSAGGDFEDFNDGGDFPMFGTMFDPSVFDIF